MQTRDLSLLRIDPLPLALMAVNAKENPEKWFYPVCVVTYDQNESIIDHQILRYNEDGVLEDSAVKAFQSYAADQLNKVICCLCHLANPAILVLRRIDVAFTLSRSPGTAGSHLPNCSYSLDSSRETAPISVTPETNEHSWKRRKASITRFMGDGISIRPRSAKEKVRPPRRLTEYKKSRPALVTLAHDVMHDAGTNISNPADCHKSLGMLMSDLARGSAGIETTTGILRDDMYFASHDTPTAILAELDSRVDIAGANHILLMGCVQETDFEFANDADVGLTLTGLDLQIECDRKVFIKGRSKSQYRSRKLLTKGHSDENIRVMAVLAIRLEDGRLIASTASFFVTTPEWIPVESSHELRMASHLIRSGYHFTKPLRDDPRWRYRHDFILHLASGDYPIEVNGMSKNQKYCDHKKTVSSYLQEVSPNHHCCWWPEINWEIPQLPPPQSR